MYAMFYGGVGEVVNTPDCGSGMQGFDPLIPPHIKKYRTLSSIFLLKNNVEPQFYQINV